MPSFKKQRELIQGPNKKKTRQTRNIEIQFREISNAQKSIFYKGVKMYNLALPSKISNKLLVHLFCAHQISYDKDMD